MNPPRSLFSRGEATKCNFLPFFRRCNDTIETLVVSGGGMKGVASLGAVSALRKMGSLRSVKTVVGTSAGALVAAAFATDRADARLLDELCRSSRLRADIELHRVLSTFGLDTGANLDAWIGVVLGGRRYTFRQLYRERGVRLVVCATNVSTRRAVYFSPESTPEMDVGLSLRMSCSIPLYFAAVPHDGELYVDGAVSDNFPLEWAARRFPGVAGIAFKTRLTDPTSSLEAYLGALVECSTRRAYHDAPDPRHVLEIDTGAASAFDFTMRKRDMRSLFSTGEAQARAWVKKNA